VPFAEISEIVEGRSTLEGLSLSACIMETPRVHPMAVTSQAACSALASDVVQSSAHTTEVMLQIEASEDGKFAAQYQLQTGTPALHQNPTSESRRKSSIQQWQYSDGIWRTSYQLQAAAEAEAEIAGAAEVVWSILLPCLVNINHAVSFKLNEVGLDLLSTSIKPGC
jgi:hypothetical protein